jgi:predicted homoserine dehydrogenase-like protein
MDDQMARCNTLEEAKPALRPGHKFKPTKAEIARALSTLDYVVEATENPTSCTDVALATITAKKHVVIFNIEGDVLVGDILKSKADEAGVIYTGVHGEEPGVKALYDEADALGFQSLRPDTMTTAALTSRGIRIPSALISKA